MFATAHNNAKRPEHHRPNTPQRCRQNSKQGLGFHGIFFDWLRHRLLARPLCTRSIWRRSVGVETMESWAADPFGFLGRHGDVVRAYCPGATAVEVVGRKTRRRVATLDETAPGLFSGALKSKAPYA